MLLRAYACRARTRARALLSFSAPPSSTQTYTHTYKHTKTLSHKYQRTQIDTHTHIYIFTYMYMYVYTYRVYAYTHVCIKYPLNMSIWRRGIRVMVSSCANRLQHTATHCNILQHTATHTVIEGDACESWSPRARLTFTICLHRLCVLPHTQHLKMLPHTQHLKAKHTSHGLHMQESPQQFDGDACESWSPRAQIDCNTLQHTATHYHTHSNWGQCVRVMVSRCKNRLRNLLAPPAFASLCVRESYRVAKTHRMP